MSSPAAASADRKNKQVTAHTHLVKQTPLPINPFSYMRTDSIRDGVDVLKCCSNVQALLGERGAQGPIWQPGPDKYGRLDRQLQNANSQFIEEQHVQQQVPLSNETFTNNTVNG